MLKLSGLLLTLVIAVSCNEKDSKKSSSQDQINSQDKTKVETLPAETSSSKVPDNFTLSQSYQGTDLLLVYPHAGNWGWWRLKGDDAKKLYETLRVKETDTPGGIVYAPGRSKDGSHVTCYRQSLKEEPANILYSCSLYIEYKNAKVNEITRSKKVKVDKKIADISEDFKGTNLRLDSKDQVATLMIDGDDAKALYLTLDDRLLTGINEGSENFERKVDNFDCRKGLNVTKFKCLVRLDLKKGSLALPKE